MTEKEANFYQHTLDLHTEQFAEIELGNCFVLSRPTYTNSKKDNKASWECTIDCQPDLFHLDQQGMYVLRASQTKAREVNKLRLRPGDRAMVKGQLTQQQEIMLTNGEKRMLHYVLVTAVQVFARAPRLRVTTYETRRGRKKNK